jgi:hypothetical protein
MTKIKTTTTTTDDEKAIRIAETTFVLNLTIGAIRQSAKVRQERVEVMAEALRLGLPGREPETVEEMVESDGADELRVNKALLKVEEVQAIIREAESLRDTIRRNSLRSGKKFLKGGLYLYSSAMVEWAEAEVGRASDKIAELCTALEDKWPAILQDERRRLEPLGLFDPRDYPEPARIREAITPRLGWLAFEVPQRLAKLNKALFEAEKQKAKEAWAEMFDQIRATHAQAANAFLTQLAAALRPDDDGKRRVLRQKSLDRMMDFLRTYRLQDVTGWEELAAVTDKARDLLSGVDAEVLREEKRAAQRVLAGVETLMGEIAPLLEEAQRTLVLTD